jgi:serine protease AprX
MAFVDSGFFPHADLMRPVRRVLLYADATRPEPLPDDFLSARPSAWHGTMTACAAAGNGWLSGGRYRGLASEAQVVLIKCADDAGAIRARNVAHAIRFPLRQPQLDVRVLNVSVGVDPDDPDAADAAAVRDVVAAGVTVFAAAGNRDGVPPEPPADDEAVITVGGWDDENTVDPGDDTRYPSSFGGGKPDLLAPAAWLPAPMLPGTLEAREARCLFELLGILEERQERATFSGRVRSSERERATLAQSLAAVSERIEHQKYISIDYQHVEGTSFAAPIAASVAAQMIERDGSLTPALVREGLLAAARPIAGVAREAQGRGLLAPRAAVRWVEERISGSRGEP